MNIGELRHRISIQQLVETPTNDNAGSDITSAWTTLAILWAKIESIKGLTYLDNKQIGETVTHKITLRYLPNLIITSEHWLLFKNRHFCVRSVRNALEQNKWIELLCEENSTTSSL